MVDLAVYLKKNDMRPRQVQDFIPTPMSMAACMYHTGLDPFTRKPVYTARDMREKRLQKALLLYWDPAHHDEAREALVDGRARRSHRHQAALPRAAGERQGLAPPLHAPRARARAAGAVSAWSAVVRPPRAIAASSPTSRPPCTSTTAPSRRPRSPSAAAARAVIDDFARHGAGAFPRAGRAAPLPAEQARAARRRARPRTSR